MAFRFCDSFDDRSTAQLALKYNSISGASVAIGAVGRNSTQGLNVAGINIGGLTKTFDNQDTWIIGFAINRQDTTTGKIVQFFAAGQAQCQININADGSLSLFTGGSHKGTTSQGLQVGVWQFVEIKVTIHNTAGVCVIRFDEVDVMNLSGVNTANYTSILAANSMILFTDLHAYIDDLYILDDYNPIDGQIHRADFIGDCRVECLLPNAAGTYAQWTPSAGANYQNVDDPASPGPDGDSTYNETDVQFEIDSFNFPSLSSVSGNIMGLATNLYARKTESGGKYLVGLVRHSGTDYPTQDYAAIQDTYTYEQLLFENNPVTAQPWTISDVNSDEFGYKDVSP